MPEFGPSTYGDNIADIYDAVHAGYPWLDPAPPVDFLAPLAEGGRALELGIGTGRIALPLRDRGIEVHGVDASELMVEQLRRKPGGADIPVAIGDFADVPVDGTFRLVYAVFNTFYGLPTQAEQVGCFRRVAQHLTDDGSFVIEAWVPNPSRYERGRQRVGMTSIDADHVQLEISEYDLVEQTITSQFLHFTKDGVRLLPAKGREVWPGEFNLMAELAGLELRERWGGWDREPFSSQCRNAVSVYGLKS